jgi:hypothetical protein
MLLIIWVREHVKNNKREQQKLLLPPDLNTRLTSVLT